MKTKIIALVFLFISSAASAQTIDIYCSMAGVASNDPTPYYLRIAVDIKKSIVISRNARMPNEKTTATPADITESTIDWEANSSINSIDRINGGYVIRQSAKGGAVVGPIYARGQCKKISEKLF